MLMPLEPEAQVSGSSVLLVLIVRYMGHDLSTVVDRLKARAAIRGKVVRHVTWEVGYGPLEP
jgi:hypothetical protein